MKKKVNLYIHQRLRWLVMILLAACGLALGFQSIRLWDHAEIILEWTTASEMDVVGYNVLRGETQEGPFIQINPRPIPPSDDPLVGGEYIFEDGDVQVGQTYYYILEDIESSGLKNQHGPVTQKAENSTRTNLALSGLLMTCAGLLAWSQIRKPGRHEEQKPSNLNHAQNSK